jgi:hypothetical protein
LGRFTNIDDARGAILRQFPASSDVDGRPMGMAPMVLGLGLK